MGEFSVQSAYQLEQERQKIYHDECSHNSGIQLLWKTIWGMHVPNPVNMFLWRACHNILPTKDNLNKRCIDLDPCCVFCLTE
jgi:hypothetical protein